MASFFGTTICWLLGLVDDARTALHHLIMIRQPLSLIHI